MGWGGSGDERKREEKRKEVAAGDRMWMRRLTDGLIVIGVDTAAVVRDLEQRRSIFFQPDV